MTYLTICDARQPVPVAIPMGTSISMTSMSLIYDFYNITKPQEIVKFSKVVDDDDKNIFFENYQGGVDFSKIIIGDGESYKIKQLRVRNADVGKIDEFKLLNEYKDGEEVLISTKEYVEKLRELLIFRYRFLDYFMASIKFKSVTIKFTDTGKSISYPALDSGIDDYIHEMMIRSLPGVYDNSGMTIAKYSLSDEFTRFIENTKTDTIDNVLNKEINSNNRKYYFDYINKNIGLFDPKIYFSDNRDEKYVFTFLRINNYTHGILKFLKEKEPDYYDTIKNREVEYYDKSNIKNKLLIDIIDRLYGGDNWKCFKKDFIKTLGQSIYTTLKTQAIDPGFYSLSSLLEFHFSDILEFDYNKFIVINKGGEEEQVTIIRPVGSTSYESHGELYDILYSKDSLRMFPDIIGTYKNINVHCEQINDRESVFIDRDGNSHYNKMIGTVRINPSDGEFFGVRGEYDNERRIYFKLASPACSITHLNFYFTDCEGRRLTINTPVQLNVIVQ